MAVKRGKSQARRNNGNSSGLPGWAWLVLGLVLGIGVILAAPRFLKQKNGDGFFRPHANPDAQPANSGDDDALVPEDASDGANAATDSGKPKETQYDFYTLLPGEEVAMSDAELAASAREEEQRRLAQEHAQNQAHNQGQDPASAATAATATPVPPAGVDPATATAPVGTDPAAKPTTSVAAAESDSRYILQAGAFAASGDAEALKAKIALLGLGARVESAQIKGKTMYRVRMGPYGTASELAEAKQKLGNGGLPALAIRAK